MTIIRPDQNVLKPTEKNMITAWIQGLSNPLVPLAMKVRYENDMIALTQQKPHIVCSVFSGAISMLMRALPAEDPWRKMTVNASYDVTMPDGDPFNSYAVFDLVEPTEADRRMSPELSPMVEEISDASKVLVATGPESWTATLAKAESMFPLVEPTEDQADGIFHALEGAFRWAGYRYNNYSNMGTTYYVRCFAIATMYYDAPMKNNTKILEAVHTEDPETKIADGTWDSVTNSDY